LSTLDFLDSEEDEASEVDRNEMSGRESDDGAESIGALDTWSAMDDEDSEEEGGDLAARGMLCFSVFLFSSLFRSASQFGRRANIDENDGCGRSLRARIRYALREFV